MKWTQREIKEREANSLDARTKTLEVIARRGTGIKTALQLEKAEAALDIATQIFNATQPRQGQ